jgi:hypothetical protein
VPAAETPLEIEPMAEANGVETELVLDELLLPQLDKNNNGKVNVIKHFMDIIPSWNIV